MEWIHTFIPGSDPNGKPVISVIAKRTYTIAHQQKAVIAEEQQPLFDADQYAEPDNAMYSEVIAECDILAWKPTTDVVVLGKARPPKGKQAYHLDCEVEAGPYKKAVRVFGNRKVEEKAFKGLSIGSPEPFTEIDLGYKNAYGGYSQSKNGTLYSYYPNPIGKGFTLKGAVEDVATIKLPNLEDTNSPLTPDNLILSKPEEWQNAPKPASVGWTRKNFYPRYTFCGVLPEFLDAAMANLEQMKKDNPALADTKLPHMDYRFFQGASDGLWGKQLSGNETVRLKYMDAEFPSFEFQLPGDFPVMTLDIGNGPVALTPVLHTIMIEKEKNLMAMAWRGSMEYGGIEQLAELQKLEVKIKE